MVVRLDALSGTTNYVSSCADRVLLTGADDCVFQTREAKEAIVEIDAWIAPSADNALQLFFSLGSQDMLQHVLVTKEAGRRKYPCLMLLFPNTTIFRRYVQALKQLGPSQRTMPLFSDIRAEDAPQTLPLTLADMQQWRSKYPKSVEHATRDDGPTFVLLASVVELCQYPLDTPRFAVYTYSCTGTMVPPPQQDARTKQADAEQTRQQQALMYETCQKPQAAKICSRCKKVRYCCVECQKQHWSTHKSACQK